MSTDYGGRCQKSIKAAAVADGFSTAGECAAPLIGADLPASRCASSAGS
jgi:hypothetical protein